MRTVVLSIALLLNACVIVLLLITGYVGLVARSGTVPLPIEAVPVLLYLLAVFGLSSGALAGLLFGWTRPAAWLIETLVANVLLAGFVLYVLIMAVADDLLAFIPIIAGLLLICLGNVGFFAVEVHARNAESKREVEEEP